MANIDNLSTFDINYLLSEKPADGYYISASNYLPNHEPEILTQPNKRLFKTRGGECEIKFYFENHGRFYRPDIFCPFNLNGTGTPELKFRLQLSKSTTIPILTVYADAQPGSTSIVLASTDTLSLDPSNWITIKGLSTKYWLNAQYNWGAGDYVTIGIVDALGAPLGLESAVSAGDDVYTDKLGDGSDIIFDQEYRGVLPTYPWGIWTPYSLTIPWGGYDIDGRSEQFITTIDDFEYSSSDSIYCGKLTITGGPTTGIAIQRLFIGQATIKNAYLDKSGQFETSIEFVNDQPVDNISITYNNLDTTTYTLLNEMAKSVVLVADDVLFYLRHAEKNYVYAGFIPKSEIKLVLRNSVMDCEAKYLNEWDFTLKVGGYS